MSAVAFTKYLFFWSDNFPEKMRELAAPYKQPNSTASGFIVGFASTASAMKRIGELL